MTGLAVKEYEEMLEKESIDILMQLSPGIRLQTIINKQETAPQQVQRNSVESRKPSIISNISEPQEINKKERWDIIVDLLESKRKQYKDQWKQQVNEHFIQSQKRLLPMSIPKKMKPAKESIRDRWKRVVTMLPPGPDKKEPHIKRKMTPRPTEKRELKPVNDIITPPPKAKPTTKYFDSKVNIPVLRALSIDQPLQKDAMNLWNRTTHTMPEQLSKRISTIVQMSNSIIKSKESFDKSLISDPSSMDNSNPPASVGPPQAPQLTVKEDSNELKLTNDIVIQVNNAIYNIANKSRRKTSIKNIKPIQLDDEDKQTEAQPIPKKQIFKVIKPIERSLSKSKLEKPKSPEIQQDERVPVSTVEYPKMETQPLNIDSLMAKDELKYIKPRKAPSMWIPFS